ncbi:DUF1902 domain-containing protein [Nitrosococcus watsonii]|uniref:DUF1902 domain-containing protein n=1 Tax=Nitrosococcus watsoni (strain C-113) TaxID=105559 RepID=D8K755_NITWC|nr:DUF1902 domain-containing protein [Nitrosococcus watsonii]ADJ28732.1 Domain of unknown function DUF1902 [Nitrosococcus watsonii C-113]
MPNKVEFHIEALWDEQAHVWVATSEDVPGLATEADTQEALMEKLNMMVPELLVLNGVRIGKKTQIEVLSKRKALLPIAP